ncbi:MAG: PHP domain-containing protein [Clostridiales bacterium]|nr:PHP domain-containing protein [Clostridiales bacterium]
MKILVDTHVHTIASGHAYSTLNDYIEEAKIKGLEMFALTDHAIAMPGTAGVFHFYNQVVIPREVNGIKILRGTEANVIDFNGTIDVEEKLRDTLDLIIGSFHPICLATGSKKDNTNAYINMMKRNQIQIIGHPGNLQVEIDIEEFVKAAKYYDIAIEINNSTFTTISRKGSEKNCEQIIEMGLKHDAFFTVSSDAHIRYDLGNFTEALSRINKYNVPIEKIVNANSKSMIDFLMRKGKLTNGFY